MKKILNWKLALITVILIASFLRLWQLGSVPSGTPNDEAAYIYNAYSIWHTGKDILGNFLPLSFNAYSSMSPIPVYLTAPFVGVLGLSIFSGRLCSALVSIGSVFILFLLTDLLFKNKRLALLSALLLAISPWSLQLGRGLWDFNFALLFLLLGIYVFVKNVGTNKILWSIIPFVLGFYSYHGTKVYFLFLIPVLIFFFREQLLKNKKILVIFLTGCFLILASFLIVIKTQSVTRQSQVSLLSDPQVAIKVNWERQYNTAPWIIRSVFSNKPLSFLKIIRENYLEVFSTNFLFLYGDISNGTQIYNISFRGELYIIELPLLLLGLYALFKNKNIRFKNLLLSLLLISPFPSVFTIDRSYVGRDIMMLPMLLIIVAFGLDLLLCRIKEQKAIFKWAFLSVLVIAYLFLFSEYLYQYYYRWTSYGAEGWQKNYRDITALVATKRNEFKNIYIGKHPKEFLFQYAITERLDPKLVQKVWSDDSIKFYNMTLFKECFNNNVVDIVSFLPPKTFYASPDNSCNYKLSTPSATIVDTGEPLRVIWNIYENK
jgi:4-amino-4-deoxy-L-arabinose transferase-like glycosyltransferase